LVSEFDIPGVKIKKIFNQVNLGVKVSTRLGIDAVFMECDMFMTLNGDAMVRADFVDRIMELPKDSISTGFHCAKKNRDRSERHKIVGETSGYYIKMSVSGINMCFSKESYIKYIEPALIRSVNWDEESCNLVWRDGKFVYCVKESVIQHLGVVSAMGHDSIKEPDTADDFYLYDLPNTTLIGAATNNYEGLSKSMKQCTKYIRFGGVVMLTSGRENGTTYIPPLKSKTQYSLFCLHKMTDYVKTDYALVFQPDGMILNPCAWDYSFLNYDYIGAVWNFHNDTHRVGNGGFSLRSKRLMDITKNDSNIVPRNDDCFYYAEDHQISRLYRGYLENKYDIKFAPEDVAEKFSIENYGVHSPNNKYKGSFGIHGKGSIDYKDAYTKPFFEI
jgi:hypothetical protein